jgi:hypothetical protein
MYIACEYEIAKKKQNPITHLSLKSNAAVSLII